ncbi:MAG: hypothetical protein QOJ29_496 [Thermoleophilaceae bacterium]|nr:hypothetical protein [Thermoleophilaceae bacterium]
MWPWSARVTARQVVGHAAVHASPRSRRAKVVREVVDRQLVATAALQGWAAMARPHAAAAPHRGQQKTAMLKSLSTSSCPGMANDTATESSDAEISFGADRSQAEPGKAA